MYICVYITIHIDIKQKLCIYIYNSKYECICMYIYIVIYNYLFCVILNGRHPQKRTYLSQDYCHL